MLTESQKCMRRVSTLPEDIQRIILEKTLRQYWRTEFKYTLKHLEYIVNYMRRFEHHLLTQIPCVIELEAYYNMIYSTWSPCEKLIYASFWSM